MQWLDVIGIGEDGFEALSLPSRKALENADVIIGGDRHHALTPHLDAERIHWPRPFSKMIATVTAHRPRKTALLVTGDPLWYSAGAKLLGTVPLKEMQFHPQLSAFQLACVRMGWSLPDIETLTVHGRPIEQLIAYLRSGARLAVLTGGSDAVIAAARLLIDRGYGKSEMTVLAAMGGPHEIRFSHSANDWVTDKDSISVPAFHTLCIECIADANLKFVSRMPGLPDQVFVTDGNFTKREIRAVTVSMLAPYQGELLWDIGIGSGTVAIEWMRAARGSRAIGIDHNPARIEMARRNALQLGVPGLELIQGQVPEALDGLPAPNAVFLGGGLSHESAKIALERLRPFGRIVANAVTVESDNILAELHSVYGGDLTRLAVSCAKPLGRDQRGWHNHMTVTQWRYTK